MSVGDEHGLSEELYHQLIGRYVATIEVLTKRLFAKDQHIVKIETENAQLGAQLAAKEEPKEGEVMYVTEEEFKALKPKRKK